MLKLLLLTALLASASAIPRSKGEPQQATFIAQSGGFPYNPQPVGLIPVNPQNAGSNIPVGLVPAVNNPQPAEATFQVNPATNEIRPILQSGFVQNAHVQSGFPHNVPAQPPLRTLPATSKPHQSAPAASLGAQDDLIRSLVSNPPGGALLVGTNPPLPPLSQRLISNYTHLRPYVVDTFRCDSTQPNYSGYGYYADVDNECQIFHVCLPLHQLYPEVFKQQLTYQYSFICPNLTVFSQDVMTCTYKSEAIDCEDSRPLYWLNKNFFRLISNENGIGEEYAEVNDILREPIIYDYLKRRPVV